MMKSKLTILFWLIINLIFVSSCANARIKPGWVESEADKYPNNLYVTATGAASDYEMAKDRALANLSKIFEAHINETSSTKSDTFVSLHNLKESVTQKRHLSQLVRVSTDKIIQGAQVVERWKDDDQKSYYALAVLDRKQARTNVMDEISRLDDETIALLDDAKKTNDALSSISSLDKAITIQQRRLSLHNMLKVINLHGRGFPSEWTLHELQDQLANKLSLLKINTHVEGDSKTEVEKLLLASMANLGFPAANDSFYTFSVLLDVNDLGLKQGWYWKKGKLTVQLLESNGKIRAQSEWLLKVSALHKEDTQSRLLTQVSNRLNSKLKSLIVSSVDINN